ncbi:heparan sulfate glucosamine 3-O-sulfotransferase 1-like [Amphiura filiformis]|uniref:heparan sulfate glucosamine 3-O-sulfotransferase 1-like n=1 Tax=Amphiura filiformis TaxID=82378 RepID=UPI003B21A283
MKSLETRRTTNLITARTYKSFSAFISVIVCTLPMLMLLCWTQYMYKDPLQHLESINGDKAIPSRNGRLTWDTSCYSYHRKKHLKSQRKLQEMGCDRKLPKALIIGVKKCGTITLTQFLDLHPEIETISGISFNPRVFVRDWVKQMPMSTSEQIIVVDSPGYIDNPETLQYMVSNVIRDLKLILMLRDPIQRAISDYKHVSVMLRIRPDLKRLATYRYNKRSSQKITVYRGYEMLGNFEETITDNRGNLNTSHLFIQKGIYIKYIKNLFENVDRNRVLIVDGDAFKKYSLLTLKKVEKFLQLSDFFTDRHFYYDSRKGFFCANVTDRPDTECMAGNKGRSHPTVHQNLLQQMSDFFTPYNLKLQEYLNQTLTFSKRNV